MKLNGYRASHRNRWLLLKHNVIDEKAFLLFEYYLDSMDWDPTHEKHGTFEVYLEDIAPFFNKKVDTVRAWHNGLLEKGFIQLVDKRRNIYRIKSPERYAIDGRNGGKASKYGKDEKSNPTLDFFLQNVCFSPEKVKINPPKQQSVISNEEKALVSSKSEFEVISNNQSMDISPNSPKKIVVIRQKVRSEEEYQKIYAEGNFQNLTPEDMKWVDENVSEKIVIENDEQEKDIVEIFFNGDWNDYQKNIVYK